MSSLGVSWPMTKSFRETKMFGRSIGCMRERDRGIHIPMGKESWTFFSGQGHRPCRRLLERTVWRVFGIIREKMDLPSIYSPETHYPLPDGLFVRSEICTDRSGAKRVFIYQAGISSGLGLTSNWLAKSLSGQETIFENSSQTFLKTSGLASFCIKISTDRSIFLYEWISPNHL